MSSNYVWSSYGQIDSEKFYENTDTFENYSNNLEILYSGEYIVGIKVFGATVYVNDGIGEDNNGASYKTYYEYAYLCCNMNEEN